MSTKTVSSSILNMAMHDDASKLLLKLKQEQIQELLDISADPSFGKEGIYYFYCNKCGGSWNFKTKEELKLFKSFHKVYKCDFEASTYNKSNKNVTGITIKRTGDIISSFGRKYMEELINAMDEEDEARSKKTEVDVSEEPEAKSD